MHPRSPEAYPRLLSPARLRGGTIRLFNSPEYWRQHNGGPLAGMARTTTAGSAPRPVHVPACIRQLRARRLRRLLPLLLLLVAALFCPACRAQFEIPDAPTPQPDLRVSAPVPGAFAGPASGPVSGQQSFPPTARVRHDLRIPGLEPNYLPIPQHCSLRSCSQTATSGACCRPQYDAFANYLKQNAAVTYTPGGLGRLAFRGVIDPFNLLTIGGTSAISVASSPHSPYGPGMWGWTKLNGVTLTEDMTSEFVGTFLIPSLDHQDPHYYRMPNAPIIQRVAHCIYQPFWTVSQTGQGMVNYSNVLGAIIEEAVDISYVPYQKVGWGPSALRISTNYATMPIGNFVSEFVPDVARRINLHAVFLQRIINRVAVEEGGGPF